MSFNSEGPTPTLADSLLDSFPTADPTLHVQDAASDLCHLVPVSDEAKVLFNSVAWHYLHAHLDSHHRSFLPDLAAYQYASDDLVDPTKHPFRTQEQAGGFWRIGIEDSTLKNFVWSFGKGDESFGNQDVDVKLAMALTNQAPDGSFYCAGSLSLAPKHFQIFMHSTSGVFMLEALESLEIDNKALRKGKMVALMKPLTLLKIGSCTFWLSFKVDDHLKESDHLRRRNTRLGLLGAPIPRTRISGVPMMQDVMIEGRVVFRHGLGYGTFGNVCEGYAPTGSLRAIKRLAVRTETDRALVKNERIALEKCQECTNVVRLYCTFNGRGGRDEGVRLDGGFPFEVFFVFEKGQPFHEINFDTYTTKTKIKLAQGVLRALKFIHGKNMLHRDLTIQNMIVAGTPAEAKLIDFGKAKLDSEADSSYLAAECYLPPEIVLGGNVKYSFELDIHMAGHAMARAFAARVFIQGKSVILPRVLDQWKTIQQRMRSHPNNASDTAGLMDMLIDMMNWHPTRRPSAESLLTRDLFDPTKRTLRKQKLLAKQTGTRLDGNRPAAIATALPLLEKGKR